MCGIAGALSFDGAPPSRELLATMNEALVHRGPDGEGVELLGVCGLAHRRLSIIDLSSAGHQPMSTSDGRLWLSFNGEIYNYRELRAELQALGFIFRSETDSEVILHAYRAWGVNAFSKFNGMWALAIWDTREQQLLLSRDRLGIKPLYIHRSAQRLLFASEMKAILAADPRLAELDRASIDAFLTTPIVGINRATHFRDIQRFEAATTVIIGRDGRTVEHHYWPFVPPRVPIKVPVEEASERVRELLADAVRLRFRADVPVGTCLSGGLDSSAIVALAKRLGHSPRTFSALYQDAGFEEETFVRTLVDDLGLANDVVRPDASDLFDVMTRCAYYQEEPTAGPGVYTQWHVMRIASRHVTVLLDGQGSDEIFGGYFHYFNPYAASLVLRAARLDLEALHQLAVAGPSIKALTGTNAIAHQLTHVSKQTKGVLRRFLRTASAPWGRTDASPALDTALGELRKIFGAPALAPTGDPLTDTLWDQTRRSSIPALLHYEDRNSMAFSIEARVPFLDYRLVEYAFSLPNDLKINREQTKVVLRESMRGILPETIRQRRDKKGYPTPFSNWLRQARHRDSALELLTSKRTEAHGFFKVAEARRLWDEHLEGSRDHAWRLWQLMSTELFCRRFVDGTFRAERSAPARAS